MCGDWICVSLWIWRHALGIWSLAQCSSKPFLQGLFPAAPGFLTSNALPLAYLQDLLVANYCSTGRLAVSRILLCCVFEPILCGPLTIEDPWKSLSLHQPGRSLVGGYLEERGKAFRVATTNCYSSRRSCNYGIHQFLELQIEKLDI